MIYYMASPKRYNRMEIEDELPDVRKITEITVTVILAEFFSDWLHRYVFWSVSLFYNFNVNWNV